MKIANNAFRYAILTIAAMIGMCSASAAKPFAAESLNYEIVYHWGLVWKHAASATLSIKPSGDIYNARLTARTVSWADKIYPVRDTLRSSMKCEGLKPVRYVKSTHEKDYKATDIVDFTHNGNATVGKCTRIRKGNTATATLEASTTAYDMLSVFYYLRSLEMEKMSKGQSVTVPVFSGKEKEKLTITYRGVEQVKMRDNSKRLGHYITFRFTEENGKKSSDDIKAWISADANRIPLLLIGKVKIGEVRCYYKP